MPQTPQIFFAQINFRYYPHYFGENVFGPGFFPQMLYLLKVRKVGTFLALGRQHRRMRLVYIVTRNKRKQRDSFLFFTESPIRVLFLDVTKK